MILPMIYILTIPAG